MALQLLSTPAVAAPGGPRSPGRSLLLARNRTQLKIHPQGCDNGALLDRFGVLIQALLAVVAFSTLMLKRFKEPKAERRPWRIWFYDTSKQAIGALFIHFANVFLSDLTEEDPCSLYLMNFILDATLGMLLIWLGVKVVSWIVESWKFTHLVFGEYGDPPQAAAWIGQCILYLLIMVFEKAVISLVLLIPGWTKLQEILLDYIPDPQLELVLVMLVVPFVVNAVMFWVVDSLIMKKHKQKESLEGDIIVNPRTVKNEEYQAQLSVASSWRLPGPCQGWLRPPEEASVLLFPGQGSQFVGVGLLLYYPGYDLRGLCLRGPEAELGHTARCQPAVFVASLAALEVLHRRWSAVLLCPALDLDCDHSDQDLSGSLLQGMSPVMPRQADYHVAI
ncbi:hypothetical protein lerEdw1_000529 [Lerista edwardsae]|nr:hypothetical protein lerEdw1_000529 [Lerista edwardsae]